MESLYYSLIHSHTNYANIVWASTNKTKLAKLYSKQKWAIRIITFQDDKHTSARPLMTQLKILNIYQTNIYQILLFMFRIRHKLTPNAFKQKFFQIKHKYPSRFSCNNFLQPKSVRKSTDYSILHRGPSLWNKILDEKTKIIQSLPIFRK